MRHCGKIMVRNTSPGEAPSVFATNSMRELTSANAVRTMRTANGRLTMSWANTIPVGSNTTANPASLSALPNGDENMSSSAKPSKI